MQILSKQSSAAVFNVSMLEYKFFKQKCKKCTSALVCLKTYCSRSNIKSCTKLQGRLDEFI